jgi:hypothetical protein
VECALRGVVLLTNKEILGYVQFKHATNGIEN